jgi:putative mRNA 3-end processing factor
LGKAQRLIGGLDPGIGPIFTHGAVEKLTQDYRASGVALPPTSHVGAAPEGIRWAGAMIVAPPSADATPWTRKFGLLSNAFASGWMRIRGTRRRRSLDRGFVLSDHVDWPSLVASIEATGAERVWVTHGYTAQVVRWLRDRGFDALAVETRFTGERADLEAEPAGDGDDRLEPGASGESPEEGEAGGAP